MKEWQTGDKFLLPDRNFAKDGNRKCTILSNLSGGLDSVYGTYRLLKEGEHVLIHHCHLTSRKRMVFESMATARVLEWFRKNGLNNFDYIDSAVTLPPAEHLKRMRDPEVVMALSGTVFRTRPHLKRMAYWNIVGDTTTEEPSSIAATSRVDLFFLMARRRNITIERPLETWTKTQVIQAMPRELFEMSFWCRYPVLPEGKPCRKCKTCLDVYKMADNPSDLTLESRKPRRKKKSTLRDEDEE